MLNPIVYNNNYSIYNNIGVYQPRAYTEAVSRISPVSPIFSVSEKASVSVYKTSPSECQTCKSRKYMDQSKEGDVSFQTPTHISPENSFSAVSAHEGEHLSNAIAKGNEPGAKLISSSVSLRMSLCPECGTTYVAGGMTKTQIKYETNNPYEQNRKAAERSLLLGMNVNYVA